MAYSRQDAVSDGTLQVLDIAIQYMRRADIFVLLDDVLTTDWAWVGVLNSIAFPAPIPDGVTVTVRRRTRQDKVIHEFAKGALFNSTSMDTDFRQMLYLAQEYSEGAGVSDFFADVNMHGFRLTNLGRATEPGDAIPLFQYNEDVGAGAEALVAVQALSPVVASHTTSITTLFDKFVTLASNAGAGLVGWTRGAVGAVTRTLASKAMDVVHVRDFGAVCDGVTDDWEAVQKAFDWVIDRDGPTTLDMTGGVCAVSKTVVVKPGGHAHFKGRLKALPTFTLNAYVVDASSQTGGLVHHDLSFDLEIDAAWRGGCIRIDNYIRVLFKGTCRLLHFITDGVRLNKSLDAHEATLESGISAFEYLYGESSPGYPGETPARSWTNPTPGSVGINVNSFDNFIGAVVSYYTGTGMIINAQYNVVHGAHLGGITYGLRVTANASFVTFNQVYMDSAGVLITSPWHTEFIGCKFLHNTADTTFTFVTLQPTSLGQGLHGLKITGCTFHNIGSATVRAVVVDTSGSLFDFAPSDVRECLIADNSHSKCIPAYTRLTLAKFQAASTTWTVDFSQYLPFGAIQTAQHSFLDLTNSKPASNLSAVGATSVTVTNSIAGNGTVYVLADVNNPM